MKLKIFIAPIVAIILILPGSYLLNKHIEKGTINVISISDTQNLTDKAMSSLFLNKSLELKIRYNELFKYFLNSYDNFSTEDYSLTNYPGMISDAGNAINQVEGTARTLPLLAAWIYSGRPDDLLINGKVKSISNIVKSSILSGTDKKSKNYWGDITDYNQRILEASDIAKVLWMTKSSVWEKLDGTQKKQIIAWLTNGAKAKTIKNNWLLAPFIIQLVLKDLGSPVKIDYSGYEEFKKNYLENGWFRDGEDGHIDYYNTWGISYDLFWIFIIGKFDNFFITDTLKKSSAFTSHLISKDGIPFMGRSMCYRTAIPAPLLMNAFIENNKHAASIAKSGLDYTWTYFVKNGALSSGTLTMGYFNNDKRFVNYYSGSGSCLWGLRSLVIAFMSAPDKNLWIENYGKLPVEEGDYTIDASKLGWIVHGNHSTGEIVIRIPKNSGNAPKIKENSFIKTLALRIMGKTGRADQFAYEYLKDEYSSLNPISDVK